MDSRLRRTARRHLDQRFERIRGSGFHEVPSAGWIATIREALGMSASDLARRMGVTPAAVRKLEQSERAGTIRLETLERVASSLGARLDYALVPALSLESQVDQRARDIARREIEAVNHSMALEDQRPPDTRDAERIEERARVLRDSSKLWAQP